MSFAFASMLDQSLDIIWESTDGVSVTKSLIFNLATTGKLVQQKADEKHPKDLLDSIIEKEVTHKSISGWLNLNLNSCAEIYNGNSTSASEKIAMERNQDGLNYIATKNVGYGFESIKYNTGLRIGTKSKKFKIAPENSILICLEGGSAGKKMGLVEKEIAFGNKLFAVVCKKWIDPEYLLMYFLSSKFQSDFQSQMSGIIGGISKAKFSNIQIPIPPLAEQKRIIGAAKNLIVDCDNLEEKGRAETLLAELLRKSAIDAVTNAQKTEEMLSASWERIRDNWDAIVDSQSSIKDLRALILNLAIKGWLTPLITKYNSAAKELASVEKIEVRELFKGTDSESDVYPKNWAVASFRNIGQWVAGSGFPTDEQGHTDKEILFCKVSDMNLPANSKYLIEANNTIDSATAKKLRATILKESTVVFPKIGGAIATNKRRLIVKPTIVDNNCMGITPCSVIDSEWLFILLSSIDFVKYQSGTSIPSISQRTLDQIEFGVPPLNEQKLIVEKVNQLMKICDELENRILEKDKIAENFAKSIVVASA